MYLDIGTQKPQGKPFAINLAIRNVDGTVKRYKYLEFDTGAQMSEAWTRFTGVPRKKKTGEAEVKTDEATTDSK